MLFHKDIYCNSTILTCTETGRVAGLCCVQCKFELLLCQPTCPLTPATEAPTTENYTTNCSADLNSLGTGLESSKSVRSWLHHIQIHLAHPPHILNCLHPITSSLSPCPRRPLNWPSTDNTPHAGPMVAQWSWSNSLRQPPFYFGWGKCPLQHICNMPGSALVLAQGYFWIIPLITEVAMTMIGYDLSVKFVLSLFFVTLYSAITASFCFQD